MRRRRLTKFRLDEVSGVDRPAQQRARATIRKRSDRRPPTKNGLLGALLRAHDESPNALKGGCMDLVEKSAAETNLAAVLGQVLEYAEDQMRAMTAEVRAATGSDEADARAAVLETERGRALREVIDLAEEMAEALPALAKSDIGYGRAVRSGDLAKAVDAALSRGEAEDALLKRAKDIQVERAGDRLHLTQALDAARAERPDLARIAFR